MGRNNSLDKNAYNLRCGCSKTIKFIPSVPNATRRATRAGLTTTNGAIVTIFCSFYTMLAETVARRLYYLSANSMQNALQVSVHQVCRRSAETKTPTFRILEEIPMHFRIDTRNMIAFIFVSDAANAFFSGFPTSSKVLLDAAARVWNAC